jgi:hypothetical protein
MYRLANESLEVTILDPVTDSERLGVRYCTGGYIFQVTDTQLGPLLSGPTYPDSFNWFDGQGIPDAFNLSPLLDHGNDNPLALVLGVGVCDLQAREVETFCTWEVNEEPNTFLFRTEHSFHSYTVALERSVTLTGRTVRSWTRLHNRSPMPIPLRTCCSTPEVPHHRPRGLRAQSPRPCCGLRRQGRLSVPRVQTVPRGRSGRVRWF